MHGDAHERIQMLIPWYVTGSLDEAEMASVRAHAAECVDCREEIASEARLAAQVAGLGMDVDHGWAAMRDRIVASPRTASPPRFGWLRRPVAAGWVALGPLAAAATIAGVVVLKPGEAPPVGTAAYRALGSAPAEATGNAIVMFKPDSSGRAIQNALRAADARIVDGPLASGGYLLRVSSDRRDVVLGRLRASSDVELAEPLDAAPQ